MFNFPNSFLIQNATILTSDGLLPDHCCLVVDGRIKAIAPQLVNSELRTIDAQGDLLLPGIIDMHGDAYERHITPRAGVQFPVDMALAANDGSLVSHGITTFYYSITDGFEPGLRSRQTVRETLHSLEQLSKHSKCDGRIHIRHEVVNTDDLDELLDWMRTGRIHLLSINDHLPPPDKAHKIQRYMAGMKRRVSMTEQEALEFINKLQAKRDIGKSQVDQLAQSAHEHNIPLASHDDETDSDVSRAETLGIKIAEFPMNEEIAAKLRQQGAVVLMGSPNLVRGGSHVGALNVAEAVKAGVLDALCSDYHYPSILRAPFMLAAKELLTFESAWALVSSSPAQCLGLEDKGSIEIGKLADMVLIKKPENIGDGGVATDIRATFVAGQPVYVSAKPRLTQTEAAESS